MNRANTNYAGFWVRTWATIFDVFILGLISIPLLVSIYGWNYFDSEKYGLFAGPADFLISLVFPAFATVIFWSTKQATPGKMTVSLKILDAETGNSPSFGQLVGRYFAYIISALPFMLGFIWVAFDKKKQGWHDKLSGTIVIRDETA